MNRCLKSASVGISTTLLSFTAMTGSLIGYIDVMSPASSDHSLDGIVVVPCIGLFIVISIAAGLWTSSLSYRRSIRSGK